VPPAIIAAPPAASRTPITANTAKCWPASRRLIAEAPSPIGRITVPTPMAKTSVIARMRERRAKVAEKYAGNITETQHGASRATTPPKNAVKIVPLSTSSRMRPPSEW